MAGTSKASRKERDVRIATKVASNSIRDLLSMHATCKGFLEAGTSDAVYQHAMMWQIRLVSFLFCLDRPQRRFLDRCVESGNADAILRQGLTEYFWIGRRGIGMELLARAAMDGNVESGYLFAMFYCVNAKKKKKWKGVLKW
ncbi:hypothetical protein Ahy_A04g019284 [Arachis hypogaea]|uniref:At2g35280-like TPR domain-containing protein n=1 Tax=Arachis hypogaea TaxID=3818 RepID=A0A445DFN2_ARAHY|nr:hypothetical protein Ahy_A04g019284 [Arachis hypogaea]